MDNKPNGQMAAMATVAFALIGLVIGAIGGITHGSVFGGIIAAFGIIPACWGMFAGMQSSSQTGLLMNIMAFLFAITVAGALIILRFVDWLR